MTVNSSLLIANRAPVYGIASQTSERMIVIVARSTNSERSNAKSWCKLSGRFCTVSIRVPKGKHWRDRSSFESSGLRSAGTKRKRLNHGTRSRSPVEGPVQNGDYRNKDARKMSVFVIIISSPVFPFSFCT